MMRRLHVDSDGERGDTLIETLIVMIIFTMVLGIITSAIVVMMKQVDKQSGLADNLGNARKAIETLDGQIRFANAITTPGTGASGDQYVEFQSLETDVTGQPEVCTQWRYDVASSSIQYRTWQVPTTTPAVVIPTTWITTALTASPVGSTPIFALLNNSAPSSHQSVTVDFQVTDGAPPQSSADEVSLTAINSLQSNTTNNSVCQEVNRP
jgi:type II secretory pathway pseudopilin PulG